MKNKEKIFAVAPMIDWTDRHCRYFHRLLSSRALLYTEMIVADAIIHGDRERLLGGDAAGPVALQLGGSDPKKLAEATRIATDYGYDEINLNVGCPSDRVQSGTFGACLMRTPELVGDCVASMKAATFLPVTVKCRIGVDEQDTGPALDALARSVWSSGAEALWVHARKAWLEGLSPKENREIPPLDYERVRKLKRENPSRFIGLNGGVENLNQASCLLAEEDCLLDGIMLGRAAYHDPMLLGGVDAQIYGEPNGGPEVRDVIEQMKTYASRHIASGGRLHHVTRHMVGLFQGVAGARRWRQILSSEATGHDAGVEVLERAFQVVRPHFFEDQAAE